MRNQNAKFDESNYVFIGLIFIFIVSIGGFVIDHKSEIKAEEIDANEVIPTFDLDTIYVIAPRP